ncbi:MAG: efflux RND transporter periplasmic adaptor subunit [Lacunisphaera sp.]|nr:efflux RND transporter periplasmic adaptor subunit [Lacunisphaera sp.]
MKPPVLLIRLAFCAVIALIAGFSLPDANAAEQLYTCGMHPQIIKKEPGNCPICGMKLTPIRANSNGRAAAGERKLKYYKSTMNPGEVSPKPGKDSMGMDLVPVYEDEDASASTIQIDAATIQRMNLRTALVEHGPVRREFRTVGTVTYNEEGLRDITTKYEGWLEKLLVNTTWAVVKAGDPLFEIYAPDVYNAQLNYVVALRAEGEAGGALTRGALARLQLYDVPADVIAELNRTKEPHRTLVFRAPADGVVIEKMGVTGQMMKPGERIYRLADLSSVWVQAEIYEKDLPFVRTGDPATVRTSYGPERSFDGKVELLLPQVQEQTRTATARIVLPNTDRFLRPGMFVDVRFTTQLADDAVLVPDMAVLRSGESNTVFLARPDGSFEPREIKLGARSQDNFYEVLSGLVAGDRIVISGQFMLDSESQLRDAIQKMLKSSGPAAEMPAPRESQASLPQKPAAAVGGMAGAAMLPAPALTLLQALANATIGGADALAKDDLPAYQKALPVMRQKLAEFLTVYEHGAHGPLGKFKDGPADPTDLKTARRDFAYFGTGVTDLVRENHLHHTAGLHIFQCPMAPGIGTGRWLQRTAELRNPYYGAAMLECGEEIDASAVPPTGTTGPSVRPGVTALPPGHPPIGGLSVVAYLQTLADEKSGGGSDACGSCGMSKAAMAAGEPCATDHQAGASKL